MIFIFKILVSEYYSIDIRAICLILAKCALYCSKP